MFYIINEIADMPICVSFDLNLISKINLINEHFPLNINEVNEINLTLIRNERASY